MEEHLPAAVLEKIRVQDPSCKIVRLTFVGDNAYLPLLAQIAKELPLAPNIISGTILQVKDETLGRLVIELNGHEQDIAQALSMIAESQVRAEVLSSC